VIFLETFYPIFALWKKSRKAWIAAIVGMHLGIGLFLGMWLFAVVMIILNLGAFGYEVVHDADRPLPRDHEHHDEPGSYKGDPSQRAA
jgi:hypothetical protein